MVGNCQDIASCDLLSATDPDTYRNAVRAAVAANDGQRVRELADQEVALDQPARFAASVGILTSVPAERRHAILKKVVITQPSSLSVLMGLGSTSPTTSQAVRWYQAAVAAHPHRALVWNN